MDRIADKPEGLPISCWLGTTPKKMAPGDPVDLWSVDAAIADDMLVVLQLIRQSHQYPGDLGFQPEIDAVWRMWRGKKA